MIMLSVIFPTVIADKIGYIEGFDKGLSYESVVPLKRVTMVNFDKDGILDDYAYLAAIPTAVFNSDGKLFSNPLLFYQDTYPVKDDKERTLDARQGLDYFMEDWMTYCYGQMDKMTLINLPKSKLNTSWKANNYTSIQSDNPYDIANKIALSDWSYSINAVVAVIEDNHTNPDIVTQGTIGGSVNAYPVDYQQFNVQEPTIGTGGTYKFFNITNKNYKYAVAKFSWPSTTDYDLQLYDPVLGMVDNRAQGYPDSARSGRYTYEVAGSYIHNYGKWSISVTAVPVKGNEGTTTDNSQSGALITALQDLARTLTGTGTVDVSLYPGTMVNIPQSPFGCRDVDFTLKWNNPNIHLGLTLVDPVGTEICSSLSREEISLGKVETTDNNGQTTMHVDRLGECRPGENYTICVFSLDSILSDMDFTLQYTWHQNFSKTEGEGFTSATNGAVLASALNAPLLYTSSSSISDGTKDTLYKLGVNNIYLVNIGGHLSDDVKNQLSDIGNVIEYNDDGSSIYTAINDKTANTNVTVFTTIDPWTYWYVAEDKPAGEYPGALFVGPAAFIAAHHGCPVLVVDLYPQLSQATVWPTDLWVKTSTTREEPSTGSMILSGKQVYSFLEVHGLGKLESGNAAHQNQEILITVADEFDIGPTWDRMFIGAALPGRFCFSPVDTAYWVSRDALYPAMIFVNPAMDSQTTLINGSSSKAKLLFGRLKDPIGSTLVITKKSGEEKFTYPILDTFCGYGYKFNEKASKYWDNFKISCTDGTIPYITPSPDPIDDGAAPGKSGAYYPDMSETEVIPFYATKAGYDNVYSTSFKAVVEDLNRGVILWMEDCHGYFTNSGSICMWDPNNPYVHEENPWRAYEPIMLYPGHLRDFVHWIFYALADVNPTPLTSEFIKFHLFPEIGSTENPDVSAVNPDRVLLNNLVKKVIPLIDLWGPHGIVIYRDALLHPLKSIIEGKPIVNIYQGDGKVITASTSGHYVERWMNGTEFDDGLENMHSVGINTASCYPAYTYLHMTWMRHGATYVIIDPWSTSDWAGIMTQMLLKRFAMGDTIGQAHELGMRAIGPEPIVGQSWWDTLENIELFGDPNLRPFVPGKDYSSNNYWEQKDTLPLSYGADTSLDGHMPFGATSYPNERKPLTFWDQYLWLIVILLLSVILAIAAVFITRKKK
jgi:hypothetical protein